MKKTIYSIQLLVVIAMLSLISCVKDDLLHTPHPDKGAVVITPTWESALEETDIPDRYRLFADGVETTDKALHTPGKHTLFIYNEPEGIQVDGHIATLAKGTDGTPCSMPGFLFSQTVEIDVPQDDTLRVEVPMERRICPVSVLMRLEGDNLESVEEITSTLNGIAGSVDIYQNVLLGESVSLPAEVSVQKAKTRATGTLVKLQWRIMGILPEEKQMLTLHFKMKDGVEMSETADISEYLQEVDKMKPIELSSTIVPPQDGDFTGGIGEWEIADGSDIEAN